MPNGIPDPRQQGRPQPPPNGPKASPGPLILLIIIYVLYIGLAIIAPQFISDIADLIDPAIPALFRFIGAIVLFIILVLIGAFVYRPREASPNPPKPAQPVSKPPSRPPAPPVGKPSPQVNKFKPVAPGTRPAPGKPEPEKTGQKEPKIFTYPSVVEGGIFGDTYIEVTDDKIVRIRSLVVEPVHMK
ncbi:MAG: hypothetical protein ACMUIG_06015 [Thermoplasmatota archaeon]